MLNEHCSNMWSLKWKMEKAYKTETDVMFCVKKKKQ